MGMYKMLGPTIKRIYIYNLEAWVEHLGKKTDDILGHKYMSAMIKKSC